MRNGGPLDNNSIRSVVPPFSGRTYVGLSSTFHKYPATQRFYTNWVSKLPIDARHFGSCRAGNRYHP